MKIYKGLFNQKSLKESTVYKTIGQFTDVSKNLGTITLDINVPVNPKFKVGDVVDWYSPYQSKTPDKMDFDDFFVVTKVGPSVSEARYMKPSGTPILTFETKTGKLLRSKGYSNEFGTKKTGDEEFHVKNAYMFPAPESMKGRIENDIFNNKLKKLSAKYLKLPVSVQDKIKNLLISLSRDNDFKFLD